MFTINVTLCFVIEKQPGSLNQSYIFIMHKTQYRPLEEILQSGHPTSKRVAVFLTESNNKK